jgi:hypothetical protein
MDAPTFWIRFVLALLATWRITHLLVSEDGPGDVIVRLRTSLAGSVFAGILDCFGCLSLWVAIPLSFFVSWRPAELIPIWLALSGAALLLGRIGAQPLVIERFAETPGGEKAYGVLRSETSDAERSTEAGSINRKVDR